MMKKLLGTILLSIIILACNNAQDLKIVEMSICKKIEKSEPIDTGSEFTISDGTVCCFTKISGNGSVYHIWYQNDVEKLKIELKIKGNNWRTNSKKNLNAGSQGKWRVDIVTTDGKVLESKEFTVK